MSLVYGWKGDSEGEEEGAKGALPLAANKRVLNFF